LEEFINLLIVNDVKHVIDTRLNNTSQLSGFSKKDDLNYILGMVNIKYSHQVQLAPEEKMLKDFKKKVVSWSEYELLYCNLLRTRQIEKRSDSILEGGKVCFLCSEDKPHYCHRRLLVEYMQRFNSEIKVIHLI